MLVKRYVNVHVIISRNLYEVNQLVLSFIEFEVMLFRSFDDFISCFFFFKILQFRFVNLSYVKMSMLSTNSMKLKRSLTLLHALNKFTL